ncbi:uncharacterized protein LOC131245540 isoform X2 [Magnolia sinica]|uniref:uncharacterized protein LOC131245540 isoform X2 n=1 Tax=Magnolia sinica TaxID=86752 RepID=UPI00265A6B8A|nr:uncharacterized protein LOC131245540 isoform X2 [Magnolia sinica]
MMRYQRVSPDILPLSNGRKSNLRTCKEDDADSGRISNYNGFEGKALRFRPGSTPSTSQDQNFAQFPVSDSLQPENHAAKSLNNHENSPGGDLLLRWGHTKRSRGSRSDSRAATDDSSLQTRQVIKIHRRMVTGVKQTVVNQATAGMLPPCAASVTAPYSRGANLRPCLPAPREAPAPLLNRWRGRSATSVLFPVSSFTEYLLSHLALAMIRNLEDRSAHGNGPQSSNGGSRILPRSAEKRSRSPPSSEKADKSASCSATAVSEKRNGLAAPADPTNVESTPRPEPDATGAAEKVNLDLFEWPRIYISLSRKEKEDDFLAMKGTKLPQRPKKRAKNVDRALQYCFPGMWLSDLTRSRYEVREKKCVKKKRRGLKGMESMESDSE